MQGLSQLLSSRLVWLVIAILVLLWAGAEILARLFWFEALGYDAVFWRILLLKLALFIAAALIVYAYTLSNLVILSRQIVRTPAPHGPTGTPWRSVGRPVLPPLLASGRWPKVIAALAPATIVGLVAASSWDTFLRFVWVQPFGRVEPVFGHDISFYVFYLPFSELAQNLLTTTVLAVLLILAAAYHSASLLDYRSSIGLQAPRPVRHHLVANIDLLLLCWASGYLLDRYALLTTSSGAVFGAGYTDVVVTRHALVGAAASTLLFAALLHWSLTTARVHILPFLVGGLLGAVICLLIAMPLFTQSFIVKPNELELEGPYLERNIAFTREAYGLARVEESFHDPRLDLDMDTIQANRPTIDNIPRRCCRADSGG
jgi:uncharacterized membrane protein (UPF0182 family)